MCYTFSLIIFHYFSESLFLELFNVCVGIEVKCMYVSNTGGVLMEHCSCVLSVGGHDGGCLQ